MLVKYKDLPVGAMFKHDSYSSIYMKVADNKVITDEFYRQKYTSLQIYSRHGNPGQLLWTEPDSVVEVVNRFEVIGTEVEEPTITIKQSELDELKRKIAELENRGR